MNLKAAFLVLALAACSTPRVMARPVTGPDGAAWWDITCKDAIGDCLDRARESCPNGYDLADDKLRPGESSVADGSGAPIPSDHTKKRHALSGEVLVKCKGT